MKSIFFFSLALAFMIGSFAVPANVALADNICHNQNGDVVSCGGGGPDVTQIMMPWGLKGADTPIVKSGSFSDRYGNTFTVHLWDGPNGVYNIYETAYYLAQVNRFLNIK